MAALRYIPGEIDSMIENIEQVHNEGEEVSILEKSTEEVESWETIEDTEDTRDLITIAEDIIEAIATVAGDVVVNYIQEPELYSQDEIDYIKDEIGSCVRDSFSFADFSMDSFETWSGIQAAIGLDYAKEEDCD